jgi:hypothetical protein
VVDNEAKGRAVSEEWTREHAPADRLIHHERKAERQA